MLRSAALRLTRISPSVEGGVSAVQRAPGQRRLALSPIMQSATRRQAHTAPRLEPIPKPPSVKPRYGTFLGIVALCSVGIYVGGEISRTVSEFLETTNLFVYEDDDDDDDD